MGKNRKEKVLVAMSGGVDSSVAAALLLKQGYDVAGAYMINYQASPSGLRPISSADESTGRSAADEFTGRSAAEPCWIPDYRDAVRVAAKLGIPLIKLDFTREYREMVLNYMYKEYEAGRTPNPDVMCNKFIKFGVWLNKAKELGFDKLATGHYANIRNTKDTKLRTTNYELRTAKDRDKDQTYFLHQLNQNQLQDVLFPLGNYLKSEVRKLASQFDLPVAKKEESMGICFVGEVSMKDFLKDKVRVKTGDIVMSGGGVVGTHDGLAFYTIGQRHIGVESGQLTVQSESTKPLYVVDKRFDANILVVGYDNNSLLFKKEIDVINVNWISGQEPTFPLKCKVRLRHRQVMQNAVVTRTPEHRSTGALTIIFEKKQRAVTPGQFAVFYLGDQCLGGGEIQ